MSLVEMHSSWLAVNSIVGCSNGCRYCFLQSSNDNNTMPTLLATPEEAINYLLKSKYFNDIIPICLLPNTDPFLNDVNINYLKKLLKLIRTNNIKNIITIITKCFIPDDFLNFLKEEDLSDRVIIYLSYSGLGESIEPNVNINNIKSNFIRLSRNNIKIIHYFRPMIPQNSSYEDMKEIIDFVDKYTDVSVITGLKFINTYIDKIDFWADALKVKEKALQAEGVWPLDAYEFFYLKYKGNHKFYQTNSCALAYKMNKSSPQYYKTQECIKLNTCSKKQRKRCGECIKRKNSILKNLLIKELKKIDKYNDNLNIVLNTDNISIGNSDLSIGDLSYLSYMCGIKVITTKRYEKENYFNSSLNGSNPLILSNIKDNNLKLFLDKHFSSAIKLKKSFKITETKRWTTSTVCLELGVQIGHVLNIISNVEYIEEKNRNISNMGDELSDVLLQLCYLLYLNKVNIKAIEIDESENNIQLLPILYGQLTETIMEKENYRYNKEREGYNSIDEFIKDRLCKMLNITYNYSIKENYNMIYEFSLMLIDASMFIKYYVQEKI